MYQSQNKVAGVVKLVCSRKCKRNSTFTLPEAECFKQGPRGISCFFFMCLADLPVFVDCRLVTVIIVWALFQALILRAAVLKNQIHVKVSLKCMAVVMHSLWSCFSPASDVDK